MTVNTALRRTRAGAGANADLTAAQAATWMALIRSHAALVKTLDGELDRAHGIGLSSFGVLAALAQSPDERMRMCDLADVALLSRSGLTRLIDRLERHGLVERSVCEQDARGAFAVLTAAGAQALALARPTYIDGVRRHFLSAFRAHELELLRGFLARLPQETFAARRDAAA